MAAASSITSSSAWPSFTASAGWMYWSEEQEGQTGSARGNRGEVQFDFLPESSAGAL